MDLLHDPKPKSAQEFLIYRKIQDGRQGSKVQNRPNLSPQITFRLETWIYFIRFWQNLAWSYYLTLKTSLRKNFSFIAKSKMAAGGQRSKIDQIWRHKSHFGSAFGSFSWNLDKTWHEHRTQFEVLVSWNWHSVKKFLMIQERLNMHVFGVKWKLSV